MPVLKKLNVYDPTTMEKHFEVLLIRTKSSVNINVEMTSEGKEFAKQQEEERIKRNKRIEREKEKAYTQRLEAEKKGGSNPSGETIDFSGTANSVVTEIKKVFYGKFDQVDKFAFKSRLHNSFLIFASHLYKKYSPNLDSVTFSVDQEESNGAWGQVNKQTFDYKIWMEARFKTSFNEYLQTLQLSNLNALSWGATFESFFKKYSPDSIVFKQLKENIYRFSQGLPPADDLNDIH